MAQRYTLMRASMDLRSTNQKKQREKNTISDDLPDMKNHSTYFACQQLPV